MASGGQHPNCPSVKERSEEARNHSHDRDMEGGAGMCQMATSFYEILQNSGLQQQMVNGWGHAYSDRSATSSSSPPPVSDGNDGIRSGRRSQSRTRHKSSSSPASASASSSSSRRRGHSSRSFKSSDRHKKPRTTSHIKKEDADEDNGEESHDDAQSDRCRSNQSALPVESNEREQLYGYSYSGEDFGGRDCFGGLSLELNTLKMHLLRRANTHQIP